jgi:hypothetical protein
MCHVVGSKGGRKIWKRPFIVLDNLYFIINVVVFHMLCFFFNICKFFHLQTVGLRCSINNESNPSL